MAEETDIGGDNNDFFVGEDKGFELGPVVDKNGVPVDMTGWDLRFVVRKSDNKADPAMFEKTAVILGTYSATPASNTQFARVVFTDTETETLKAIPYRQSWKRYDNGVETVLAFGNWEPKRVTAH